MATSAGSRPVFFATPDQSMEDKLNRFQSLFARGDGFDPDVMDDMVDRSKSFDISSILHGPMYGKANNYEQKKKIMTHIAEYFVRGTQHHLWLQWQRDAAAMDATLADDPMGINFVIPRIMASDKEPPFLEYVAIIANHDDAERIARRHIMKQPNFTPVFFQSLIATTDNDHWKRQRNHLNEVFMPKRSLAKIFPISLSRACHCAQRLGGLAAEPGKYGVQMHEFYLHEAMAQLQLALFGVDESFMESTNKEIRQVFEGTHPDPDFGKNVCLAMMKKVNENPAFAAASDPEVLAGKKPVFGPLSKSVADAARDLDMDLYDQFGNMMLILFAGHDTTAHTMTWFTYEMAKNPAIQKRVQAEVDEMFAKIEGRDMVYEDCNMLPFMTRCVSETLRRWTAVPNGTFRQLEVDETVRGPGGHPVTLPAGTYVQVANLMRQWNPNLWGPDVAVFNPDREFRGNEIWGDKAFDGTNPSSERFSPFTYAPRECLGKNFAQMEMRTILSNVFHNFTFELSEPYAQQDSNGPPVENMMGTMGPRDLTPEGLAESERRFARGQRPLNAMYLKVIPRRPLPRSSKL